MAPMDSRDLGNAQLEAGLLRTQEEEKTPFVSSGLDRIRTGPAYHQHRDSGKMSSFRRLVMIMMLSVLVGLGLALAKDPALSSSCMEWARGNEHIHMKAARAFLGKRADASATNATSAGTVAESTNRGESGATSEKPTSTTPVTSTSNQPPTTTTPSSTTGPPSTPSSTSTPEPPTTSPSTTARAPSTSAPPSSTPASSPTTSNRPETTPSAPPVTSSTSSIAPESSSSSPAEETSTSAKIEKTITTGGVATTSPVAQTLTTTLPDGGTRTITSTSWVAIVPTPKSGSNSGPGLQNAAPRSQSQLTFAVVVMALTAGILLI